MEEKLLPHIRSFDDPAQMEEERRLSLRGHHAGEEVGSTWCTPSGVPLWARSTVNQPSRFLEDIPKNLTTTPDWSEDGGLTTRVDVQLGEETGGGTGRRRASNATEIRDLHDGDRVQASRSSGRGWW